MPQIGRKNPQKRTQKPANGRKSQKVVKSRITGSHKTSSVASSVGTPGFKPEVLSRKGKQIITRMASQLRAAHAERQPARIDTTLFHSTGHFLSNSAQPAHVCSVCQKKCDKPHRAKISVQMKVQEVSKILHAYSSWKRERNESEETSWKTILLTNPETCRS